MDDEENCATCKHGEPHVFATGEPSTSTVCTVNRKGNYVGIIYKEPIKCVRYERNP